jgi:hypothetical protein
MKGVNKLLQMYGNKPEKAPEVKPFTDQEFLKGHRKGFQADDIPRLVATINSLGNMVQLLQTQLQQMDVKLALLEPFVVSILFQTQTNPMGIKLSDYAKIPHGTVLNTGVSEDKKVAIYQAVLPEGAIAQPDKSLILPG